ncbi:hypothetical protein TNIN_493231 [Trichonephila inaurata madagascariensis]|uniref:Uncharacterized protein n=1 Tax=Trichonephila inaurata madagascariensis TaxID=2747483 RepID=A0A8X7CFY3_9ARAC|nr:hypothetical protein TNIN_493231 [Trichonephila inaurata madagascariensis]
MQYSFNLLINSALYWTTSSLMGTLKKKLLLNQITYLNPPFQSKSTYLAHPCAEIEFRALPFDAAFLVEETKTLAKGENNLLICFSSNPSRSPEVATQHCPSTSTLDR